MCGLPLVAGLPRVAAPDSTVLVIFSGAALLLWQRKLGLTHLPAYRISPTGTVARVFLYLMENVGVVPAASTGATARADESYAWIRESEASLKISDMPSGLSL